MPIIISHPISDKGKKDAKRHRQKQRDAIRKNLPEIIAEESIITKRNGKTVKIPIRILDIPHFRPKKSEDGSGSAGVGQGPGKPGDIIGRRPGQGGPGGAGQEPGEDYIETEIEMEELIEMMLEDLGLPNLENKTIAELEVTLGFKVSGLQKSGPWALLDRRATAKQGMKRFWHVLRYLENETGQDELTCFDALKQSEGRVADALELLSSSDFVPTATQLEPFPIITHEDTRYRKLKEEKRKQSNAVIIAMMDVSGSMTVMKKYIARSILFWLVQFLRQIYDRVEIRFIIHHATAKLVDEDTFFHTGESGGTFCYTAYQEANNLIEAEYPTDRWNVYPFHFSDGEDFDPDRSIEEVEKLFQKNVNMFGYGEIQVESWFAHHVLLEAFERKFSLQKINVEGLEIFSGKDNLPFLGVIISKKEHVWPALRAFLRKDRWVR